MHTVFFFDDNRGWVAGSRGILLATVDGGKSWESKPKPSNDVLRDLYFTDDQHGWLLCEANIYELKHKQDSRTYLLQTSDGGASWKRLNFGAPAGDARLVRAIFNQGGRGWAFGELGAIFSTRDAGSTWTALQSPTQRLLLGGAFIDNERGWLVGAGATIIQTSDGGDSWNVSNLPEASQGGVRFNAASFVDSRLGWAVGSGGTIYRTTDGGRTWQRQISGVSADLFDVRFMSAAEGWAVGSEGTIIHTTNGGIGWSVEPSGTEHLLERVFFTTRDHGWIVGFGGTVLTYTPTRAPTSSN